MDNKNNIDWKALFIELSKIVIYPIIIISAFWSELVKLSKKY